MGRFFATAAIVVLWACSGRAPREDAQHCALCPEMVTVPAGTALLGAGDSDVVRNSDELPERRVGASPIACAPTEGASRRPPA